MNESTANQNEERAHRRQWQALPWLAALLLAVSLHLWFPRLDVEPLNDTYSADVGGRNAFFQFTERRWPDVSRNLDPLYRAVETLDSDVTLCLLGPARYPNTREWKALLEWVKGGGSLLFAAKWDDPEVELPGVSARISEVGGKKKGSGTGDRGLVKGKKKEGARTVAESTAESIKAAGKPVGDAVETRLVPVDSVRWQSHGVIEATGAESLVKTVAGEQVVRLTHGSGTIVLSASDQFFSNVALFDRDRQNGVLALRLLEAAGARRPVVFDESLNVTGTPRVVGLLLDPHLRPLTVQLLAVLVVFGWRGGRRFGGLLPKESSSRQDLADHTDALGNLYWKAQSGVGALRAYLDQLRQQLRLRAPAGRDPQALAPLAGRCGMSVPEVRQLLSQAESAAANDRLARREAAALIGRLARLRGASHSSVATR